MKLLGNLKNNKVAIVSVVSIAILTTLFYVLLMLPDYKQLYQNFYKSIKIDFHPQDLGHLQVKKFPWPVLKVDNLNEQEKVELKGLAIHFSFLSILKLKPEVKTVNIQNAKIYLPESVFNLANHEQLIGELIQRNVIDVDVNIDELTIINSTNKHKIVIKNFSLDPDEANSTFAGELLNIGKFAGSFKIETNKVDFKFNLSNPHYILDLNETYQNFVLSGGKAQLKLQNMAHFVNDNLPELSSMWDSNLSFEPVDITFDISMQDESITLSDLKFDSNWLKGSGSLLLNKNSNEPLKLDLRLSQIDLSSSKKNNNNNFNKFKSSNYFSSFMRGIIAEIVVDQVLLANGKKINDVKFISGTSKDSILVKNFSGKIASGGYFAIDGEITHNNFRSLFNGKLNLQHQDINILLQTMGIDSFNKTPSPFSLMTDLKCSLIDLYFSNMILKTNDAQLTGIVSAKLIGSTPRFSGFLNFSGLDLDKFNYPVISPLYAYAKSLFQNMKSKDYINKFIPIRTLSYLGNFDITFNDLNIDKFKFDNINLLLAIKDDQIALNNLYLNNGVDYVNLDANLNVKNIKPKLDIKINNAVLPIESISPSTLLALRNNILDNYSLDKINLSWDFNIAKIYNKDFAIEKIKFTGENDNILLLISNFNANFLGGEFKGQGSILLDPYTINFAYALNSLDLSKLSSALPKNMLNVDGAASFNGMFTTNGDSLEKQLYNLYSKSNLVVKDLKLKNISIDNFIENINTVNYDFKQLPNDMKTALLTGETQISSLKGDLELASGITTIKDAKFQTNYSSGIAAGSFNIYDFNINFLSSLTFYTIEKSLGRNYENRNIAKMGIKFTGSIFQPKKVADTTDLMQNLQIRKNLQN